MRVTCDRCNRMRWGAAPGCTHGFVIIPRKMQGKRPDWLGASEGRIIDLFRFL